jgi:two-component system, cell cycle response regulator
MRYLKGINLSSNRRNSKTLQPIGEITDSGEMSDVTVRINAAQLAQQSEGKEKEYLAIRVVAGRDMLSFITLEAEDQMMIGRDETVELRLQDRAVSKRHAVVNCDKFGRLEIIDMGSTNGTFVNGQRIQRSRLNSGDHLEIGDVSLRVSRMSSSELRHHQRVLSRLESANRDPLTGLLTRAFLEEDIHKMISQCEDHGYEFSCAFIDLDRFKPVNDTFGHQVGYEVLKNVSRILMLHVRDGDPCIRYGGDEMVVFLPGIKETDAVKILSRIRTAIMNHDWARIAKGLKISASFGVAARYKGEEKDLWLKRTDQAVYAAKHAGRNKVVAYSQLPQKK